MQRDLSFFIFNNDDELSIKILFSDKYSKEFIEHFVHVYKSILKEIMDVNELSDINYNFISDLDLLDSYNRTEAVLKYDDILDAFNDNLSNIQIIILFLIKMLLILTVKVLLLLIKYSSRH